MPSILEQEYSFLSTDRTTFLGYQNLGHRYLEALKSSQEKAAPSTCTPRGSPEALSTDVLKLAITYHQIESAGQKTALTRGLGVT